MTITNIPLNGMIDNDGSIRCFHEIQTQEVLWQFYQDVIEPQLLDELDDYLNSDYRNWIEDKIAPLPPFLRKRIGNCKFADATMDEIHEYLEEVGYSRISELPLPINNKTLMIGDTIHQVADYLKFHRLTTKDYLEYEPRCRCFNELVSDIIERLLPSEFEIEKMRIELSALQS